MRSNNVLSNPLQVELAAEMMARTFGANPIMDEDNYYYQKARKV